VGGQLWIPPGLCIEHVLALRVPRELSHRPYRRSRRRLRHWGKATACAVRPRCTSTSSQRRHARTRFAILDALEIVGG